MQRTEILDDGGRYVLGDTPDEVKVVKMEINKTDNLRSTTCGPAQCCRR